MNMSLKCCTESFKTWTVWIALAFIKWEKINNIKGFVIKMTLKSCRNEACLCHLRSCVEVWVTAKLTITRESIGTDTEPFSVHLLWSLPVYWPLPLALDFLFLDLFLAVLGSVLTTCWLLLILFWSPPSLPWSLDRRWPWAIPPEIWILFSCAALCCQCSLTFPAVWASGNLLEWSVFVEIGLLMGNNNLFLASAAFAK